MIPTLTAASFKKRDPEIGEWEHDNDPQGSLDLRWGISQDTYLNATINPDFSQVEADVTRIDANSAYSLSYPEKRPFFNNGVDILKLNSNDLQPFYSRSINDPLYALKMLNQGKKKLRKYENINQEINYILGKEID